jgi:hypothetical protein
MSEELRECPFCGGEAVFHYIKDSRYHCWVECENGDADTGMFSIDELAIKHWNSRPTEDALKAEVERLKAENDELRYIVEQFSKWTAEGGCVKANFQDFPCWWEQNRIKLELDDYCDSEYEIKHNCWVEYYRWKFRQKNNNPDTGKGGYDE